MTQDRQAVMTSPNSNYAYTYLSNVTVS